VSDDFARDIFAWLKQICADPQIPPSGFKLAFLISHRINRKKRYAWPTQQTLTAEAGLSERMVRYLVDQLRGRDHLDVDIGRGPGQASVYRMRINRQPIAGIDDENRQPIAGIKKAKPATHCRNTGNHCRLKPATHCLPTI
jgi:hypothetical protein